MNHQHIYIYIYIYDYDHMIWHKQKVINNYKVLMID